MFNFYNMIFIFLTLVNSDRDNTSSLTNWTRLEVTETFLSKPPRNKTNPLSFGITCHGRLSRLDIPASIANKLNKSFCVNQLRKP